MRELVLSRQAFDDYLFWQGQSPEILSRVNALLKEAQRTPFNGLGKPEPLKGDLSGVWSRRIDGKNRLLYEVTKDSIRVIGMVGHYD